MPTTEKTGEIREVGKVLDASRALALGETSLRLFKDYFSSQFYPVRRVIFLPRPSDLYDSTLTGLNGEFQAAIDDWQAITESQDYLSTLLNNQEIGYTNIRSNIVVGDNAGWHIDVDRGYRLSVNLSSSPLLLGVATEWCDEDFEIRSKVPTYVRPSPRHDQMLTYATGQGIFIDNNCRYQQMVPHESHFIPAKVLLRTFADPTY